MVRSGRRVVLTTWFAALAVGALGQAACGGDDDGSSSSSSSTSSGTGGSTSTSGTGGGGGSTSTSTSGTGGSTSTSTSGTGGGNLCEAVGPGECAPGQAWELDLTDPCICCTIQFCETEGNACCNEPGCMAIVDCVLTSGCEGFGCLGPCGTVIDDNGGFNGAPLAAAQAVGDCSEVPCAGCGD